MLDFYPGSKDLQFSYKVSRVLNDDGTIRYEGLHFPRSQEKFELKMYLLFESLHTHRMWLQRSNVMVTCSFTKERIATYLQTYSDFDVVVDVYSEMEGTCVEACNDTQYASDAYCKTLSLNGILDFIRYKEKQKLFADDPLISIYSGYCGCITYPVDMTHTSEWASFTYMRMYTKSELRDFVERVLPNAEFSYSLLLAGETQSSFGLYPISGIHSIDDLPEDFETDIIGITNVGIDSTVDELDERGICNIICNTEKFEYKIDGMIVTSKTSALQLYYCNLFNTGDIFIAK